MERSAWAAAALVCGLSVSPGLAMDQYHDLIRPHGHKRSDAVFNAALNGCYKQTGASRLRDDSPAFRKCMIARGFQWQYNVADRPSRDAMAGNAGPREVSGLSTLFDWVGTGAGDRDRSDRPSPPPSILDVAVIDNGADGARVVDDLAGRSLDRLAHDVDAALLVGIGDLYGVERGDGAQKRDAAAMGGLRAQETTPSYTVRAKTKAALPKLAESAAF